MSLLVGFGVLFVFFGTFLLTCLLVVGYTLYKGEPMQPSDLEKYPTSKGWIAIDAKIETNGGTWRLKPSYKDSEEFKDKLEVSFEKITNPMNGRRGI